MQYEARAFQRTFVGREGIQLRFVEFLLLMHAAVTDPMIRLPGFEGVTTQEHTLQPTANALAEVLKTFREIFPDCTAGDSHMARLVSDIVDGDGGV